MAPVTDVLASSPAPSTAAPPPAAPPASGALALYARRAAGSLVGRPVEIAALRQELANVKAGRLSAVTLEGEPGIGKTRLLATVAEIAEADGYLAIAVSADEEIRAPLLIARSIFASPAARDAVAGHPEADDLRRAFDACSGRIEPGFETQPRDERLLRAYDLCAIAFQSLSHITPLAILVEIGRAHV